MILQLLMRKQKMSTKKKINSQILYFNKWPSLKEFSKENSLIIFDQHLTSVPAVKKLISSFELSYGITSGEQTKSVRDWAIHMEKLIELSEFTTIKKIYVLGGGSVGDFGGFVASVWKRGVPLVQIPSTWLAAIDSSHGGKNALNVSGVKNQIGTIHYAEQIMIIKPLLEMQPEERIFEALGEVIKISLINGATLWKKIESVKKWTSKQLWQLLPNLVEAKYLILNLDPYEKLGLRHVLNLGHTSGHIFESYYQLPHGFAVSLGVEFAIHWSAHKGLLSQQELENIFLSSVWSRWDECHSKSKLKMLHYENIIQIPQNDFLKYLAHDKKNSSKKIKFVFVAGVGETELHEVTHADILNELKRQQKYFS